MNVEEVLKTEIKYPLQKRTILHLLLVHNKVQDALTTALKPYEVSLPQFNVLRILRGHKGNPANMYTINERMVARMSNTTRLVDKLVARGYVKRNTCEVNRRKVEIRITDQGLKALKKMDDAISEAEGNLLIDLQEKELRELNTLLDKV